MQRRLITILCLAALGFGFSGCTKCGWIWEQGGRACQSDAAPK